MSQQDPLIITAAVVGAETMREHTPYVPYSPEEIADEALACWEAGARMVHVHGRREDGSPTQDADTFAQILHQIRARCPILVQFSTGGAVGMSVEERIEGLRLRPDMATLTTGTVNFGEDVFLNSLPTIRAIAARLQELEIRPEIEIFDTGMMGTADCLVKEGLLAPPLHYDFVLGVPGGMAGSSESLEFSLSLLPEGSSWSVAGVGRWELPLAREAIARGGHVRVGLEDNIFLRKGELAEGNAALVEEVVGYAEEIGRPIASLEQARQVLGLEA